MAPTESNELIGLRRAARRLGVTQGWLRAEAEAGRIPHLKAGTRILLDLALVERVLWRRVERQAAQQEASDSRAEERG